MAPTMWIGVPEELLTEQVVLPEQFTRGWRPPMTPERRLALAVLWGAVLDLHKYRFAKRRRKQRFYMEAYQWVASDDREWEFSFVRICEAFGFDPGRARSAMLDGSGPPASIPAEVDPAGDIEKAA